MQNTDIINKIKELPSVFHLSEATTDCGGYTVMVAYLNEENLIENEESLYEVPRTLKEFNIVAALHTSENSTSWEWVI